MATFLRRKSKSKKKDENNENKTEPKDKESACEKIDILLDKYFKLCGEDNYMHNGEGYFLRFVKEQKYPQNESDVKDELDQGFEGCSYIDCLMDKFPSKTKSKKEIFDVIKYCYKYGRAPLPCCRYPPAKIMDDEKHNRDHIRVILKIIDDEKQNGSDEAETVLSHFVSKFPHNGLLQICELIPREQLSQMDEEKKDADTETKANLYTSLQEWTLSKQIPIEKQLYKLQKHLFRRIPYSPILTALNATDEKTKIIESPKPFQLALALLINIISKEIMNHFAAVDPSLLCIDLIGIWNREMFEKKAKQLLKKYSTKWTILKNDDGKEFIQTNKYKDHIYGKKLWDAIKDFLNCKPQKHITKENKNKDDRKPKYLLQIYLGLYELCGKYPRVCINIDYVDEEEFKWIGKSTYMELTDATYPKYVYPLAIMYKRYKRDVVDLIGVKSDNNQVELTGKYMMVSLFLFSIQKDDWEPIVISKLYLNYVNAVMRLHEMDIGNVLPRFFVKNGLTLGKEQINDIAKERRKSNIFDIDIDYQDKFHQYLQLRNN